MLESSVPLKFPIPFGNSAGGAYIRTVPTASQIGIEAGAASLTDGFPPVTFEAEGSGGTPPGGQDFNGLFKQITQWCQWFAAGGPVQYDSTFQTAIGGYPNNAIVFSATTANKIWLSTADNNTSNPDTGGANWTDISPGRAAGGQLSGTYPNPSVVPGAGMYTGQMFWMSANAAPSGALIANGAAVSRGGANANLFAYACGAGTTPLAPYGVGDGSTTFNVPNALGAFYRGFDSSGAIDPGRSFGSTQQSSVGGHRHLGGVGVTNGSPFPFVYGATSSGVPGSSGSTVHTDSNTVQSQGWTSTTGSMVGATATTYPLNLALTPCVKL